MSHSNSLLQNPIEGALALIEDLESRYAALRNDRNKALFLKFLMESIIQHYQFKQPYQELSNDELDDDQEIKTEAERLFHNFLPFSPIAILQFFAAKIGSLDDYQNLRHEWTDLPNINQTELDQLIHQLTQTTLILTALNNFQLKLNNTEYNSLIPVIGLVGIFIGLLISTSLLGLIFGGAAGLAVGYLLARQIGGNQNLDLYLELSREITTPLHKLNLLENTGLPFKSLEPCENALAYTLKESIETMAPKFRI